ncbi:MAG: hypothetical protein EOP82_31310 [Variovorax sp.]|nr:MAG: hypothetical protein EOP82_31310 [Variovorax sp.]
MNANEFHAEPTVADEVSATPDDAQVIAKTLPATSMSSKHRMSHVDHALNETRSYVIKQPMQAVLVAAAGSALLTALLITFVRGERPRRR